VGDVGILLVARSRALVAKVKAAESRAGKSMA
jgi:hypothetical protein